MIEKEIRELRKRFSPDKHNISEIIVCYATDSGQIISVSRMPTFDMASDEKDNYFSVLRKVCSGRLERNLWNISFATKQVTEGEEYKLLADLRNTGLKDDEVLNRFFEKVLGSVHFESNICIMLAYDKYDVPNKGKDGNSEDESDTVFSYITCAVCPVDLSKNRLTYIPQDGVFHNKGAEAVIAAPELGFVFPAFDDRATNLYGCLYYTKSTKDTSEDFVNSLFCTPVPVAAETQKMKFQSALSEALSEECSLKVINAVQERILDQIEVFKEQKSDDIPVITKEDLSDVLEEAGVPEENIASFRVKFDEEFGSNAEVSSRNLVNTSRMELKSSDLVIHIDPEHSDLIETKVIGENRYLMIRLDDNVTVNGIDLVF